MPSLYWPNPSGKGHQNILCRRKRNDKIDLATHWEAAELLLANPDFKAYADSYENADSTQLNAQSEDQEIDNLTKQGYGGCTQQFENMWDSSQSQNIRDKAIFATDTIHPQVDIQPTWKCEIWVRDVDLQNPGLNKDSEGKPKILNT